jgi:hypothetical protein
MARTIESFVTTGGNQYEKKQDTAGRTYHVKRGEGRVEQTSFAAAKSHTGAAEAFARGNFEPDSLDQLGAPFDATSTDPVNQYDRGSSEREQAADVNRWLGFRYDQNTPDDPLEAAEEYYRMKQELQEADTREEERDIKEQYGIGGS